MSYDNFIEVFIDICDEVNSITDEDVEHIFTREFNYVSKIIDKTSRQNIVDMLTGEIERIAV